MKINKNKYKINKKQIEKIKKDLYEVNPILFILV